MLVLNGQFNRQWNIGYPVACALSPPPNAITFTEDKLNSISLIYMIIVINMVFTALQPSRMRLYPADPAKLYISKRGNAHHHVRLPWTTSTPCLPRNGVAQAQDCV